MLDGHDYFAADLTILDELPEGYLYAGELTDAEKEYAAIDGSQYYTPEGAETPDDFYVYQECGTRISDTEVDNTQRLSLIHIFLPSGWGLRHGHRGRTADLHHWPFRIRHQHPAKRVPPG